MDSDIRTQTIDAHISDTPEDIVQKPKNPTKTSESAAPKPQRTPLPTSRPPRPASQPPLPQEGPTTFNPETTTKRVNELLQKIVQDAAGDLSTKWHELEDELLELLRARNVPYHQIADVSNFSTGSSTKSSQLITLFLSNHRPS
jgi:hypothetical protein